MPLSALFQPFELPLLQLTASIRMKSLLLLSWKEFGKVTSTASIPSALSESTEEVASVAEVQS